MFSPMGLALAGRRTAQAGQPPHTQFEQVTKRRLNVTDASGRISQSRDNVILGRQYKNEMRRTELQGCKLVITSHLQLYEKETCKTWLKTITDWLKYSSITFSWLQNTSEAFLWVFFRKVGPGWRRMCISTARPRHPQELPQLPGGGGRLAKLAKKSRRRRHWVGGGFTFIPFSSHARCLPNTESPQDGADRRLRCYWPSSHNGGYRGTCHLLAEAEEAACRQLIQICRSLTPLWRLAKLCDKQEQSDNQIVTHNTSVLFLTE